ncbi:uncharacterized protein LOC135395990 isoform X2 [Ornithodoros turicata]|uniref:uncharacterized protein LOC135395990 isoform X2 n=1 Tax=Ornithodoros turicata TaxID=34597 RepID=UPI0031395A2F
MDEDVPPPGPPLKSILRKSASPEPDDDSEEAEATYETGYEYVGDPESDAAAAKGNWLPSLAGSVVIFTVCCLLAASLIVGLSLTKSRPRTHRKEARRHNETTENINNEGVTTPENDVTSKLTTTPVQGNETTFSGPASTADTTQGTSGMTSSVSLATTRKSTTKKWVTRPTTKNLKMKTSTTRELKKGPNKPTRKPKISKQHLQNGTWSTPVVQTIKKSSWASTARSMSPSLHHVLLSKGALNAAETTEKDSTVVNSPLSPAS